MTKPFNNFTCLLAAITLAVLLLSLPASLRHTVENGNVYLFSRDFLDDLPLRLTGPGRFRFLLQPLIATILGIRNGLADARLSRPPYLAGLLFHRQSRGRLLHHGLSTILNLLLMGILLDSLCQWLILGSSYASAALVVGPVLVAAPYAIARAAANRCRRRSSPAPASQVPPSDPVQRSA